MNKLQESQSTSSNHSLKSPTSRVKHKSPTSRVKYNLQFKLMAIRMYENNNSIRMTCKNLGIKCRKILRDWVKNKVNLTIILFKLN